MNCRPLILPTLLLFAIAAAPATTGPAAAAQPEWTLREGAPAGLQRVIDRQPALRAAAIDRCQRNLVAARKEAYGGAGDDPQAARRLVRDLTDELAEIQAGRSIVIDPPISSPKDVEVGWAGEGLEPRLWAEVVQVIDEQDAVVDVGYDGYRQVKNHLYDVEHRTTFWVSGVATATWADHKRVTLPPMLAAIGTRQGGLNILIELHAFSQDDFIHHEQPAKAKPVPATRPIARAATRPATKPAATRPSMPRR